MKRTIVCMLMTVVLILSLSVPVWADHASSEPKNIVPLWNADENWTNPGGFVVDTENQTEGEGCVSIELGKHSQFITQITFPNVDATGMRYFEFDLYVSDLAILEAWLALEGDSIGISSSGQPDRAEKRIQLSRIAMQLFAEGCPRIGWNHIVISLEELSDIEENGGKLDLSQVNFLRVFITSWSLVSVPEAKDWVLKFDHFVLTDRQVAPSSHTPGAWEYDENKHWRFCTECGKKIDEAIHSEHSHPPYVVDREFTCYACKQVCSSLEEREKYAAWIQQVKHLFALSEEDFDPEWMTEQYNALMSEWNALAEDERDLLMGGYGAMLKDVNMAIAVREQEVLILSKYESVIAELIWLKDFLRESNWTFENWERALVIASEVEEAIDGMTRIETKVLSEYGYLAILEEAESRLIIYDPPPQGSDEPDEPGQPEEPETPDVPQTPDQPDEPTEPIDKGCSATVTGGAGLCLAALMLAAGVTMKKKK